MPFSYKKRSKVKAWNVRLAANSNTLMGDIMLSLNEIGFEVAIQGEVSSDKKVEEMHLRTSNFIYDSSQTSVWEGYTSLT